MAGRYLEVMFTEPVLAAQERFSGGAARVPPQPERDALTAEEIQFIAARDSFYLGTVSPTGWPYIQHRGGSRGFLRVLDPHRLAFADYPGNRQMISAGHLAANPRVSLFLMDYQRRERLKLIGLARVLSPRELPEFAPAPGGSAEPKAVGRLFAIDVVSYDWNCPKYITPRHDAAEVNEMAGGLRARIRELEAELARRGK